MTCTDDEPDEHGNKIYRDTEKILKDQPVEVSITVGPDTDEPYLSATVRTTDTGALSTGGHHVSGEEMEWLLPLLQESGMTIIRPSEEKMRDAQNERDIIRKEISELTAFFTSKGFTVKDLHVETACSLEVMKKDVVVRVWVDLDENNAVSYQAGYKENPYGKERHSKKREALLRQIERIINKVISGEIFTVPFNRI